MQSRRDQKWVGMKLEFKSEMFPTIMHNNEAAEIANRLLAEMLKDAPRVYGRNTESGTKYEAPGDWIWEEQADGNTHTARLIEIEEVGK